MEAEPTSTEVLRSFASCSRMNPAERDGERYRRTPTRAQASRTVSAARRITARRRQRRGGRSFINRPLALPEWILDLLERKEERHGIPGSATRPSRRKEATTE